MIRAKEVDAMKKSMGIGACSSLTYGAKTVTDLAIMLQMPIAVALFFEGKIFSSP